MSVFGNGKITAKSLDPISRLLQKAHCLFVLLFFGLIFVPVSIVLVAMRFVTMRADGKPAASHMRSVRGRVLLIENRRIISAMKIDIRSHEHLGCQDLSSVPKQDLHQVISRALRPRLCAGLQQGSNREPKGA